MKGIFDMSKYRQMLSEFIERTDVICQKLNLAAKSEAVYDEVVSLTEDMMKSLEGCKDEMYYPAVYNAAATIRSAPEKCSVSQLKDALCDGAEEMRIILQYIS